MRFLIAICILLVTACNDKPAPIDSKSERYFKSSRLNVMVEGEVYDGKDLATEKSKIDSALLLVD